MEEQDSDQQVGAPGVDRTEEPAEIHLGHDRLDALEGLIRRRFIVKSQKDARHYLYGEQEQGHSAQEIENRRAMDGNVLMGGQRRGCIEPQALEEKVLELLYPRSAFR